VRELAALRILDAALLGESGALYKDLVLDRKLVLRLTTEVENLRDPGLFTVLARVPKPADVPVVEKAIEAALESFTPASLGEPSLANARSRLRYEFLLSLSSAPRIAGTLAGWTALSGDPRLIDAHYDAVATLSEEIARVAGAFPAGEPVATLLSGVRRSAQAAGRPPTRARAASPRRTMRRIGSRPSRCWRNGRPSP
jgi:predicted Zn-dependent peptidase